MEAGDKIATAFTTLMKQLGWWYTCSWFLLGVLAGTLVHLQVTF